MSRTHTSSRSQQPTQQPTQPVAARVGSSNRAKIHVIYYSMYGHIAASKSLFEKEKHDILYLIFSGQICRKRC
jgi:hypothetical protein